MILLHPSIGVECLSDGTCEACQDNVPLKKYYGTMQDWVSDYSPAYVVPFERHLRMSLGGDE